MIEVLIILSNVILVLVTVALAMVTIADIEKDEQRTIREILRLALTPRGRQ